MAVSFTAGQEEEFKLFEEFLSRTDPECIKSFLWSMWRQIRGAAPPKPDMGGSMLEGPEWDQVANWAAAPNSHYAHCLMHLRSVLQSLIK